MTYSVDLFTGRNVFQKDYANVLQFDTPQARDQFFDSQDKITVQNTEFVHVSNDRTNITLTFTYTLSPGQQSRLDYAKFNYCRINYELVTELPETSQQKCHYYFIDSYRIVSSTTDRTVVRFAISEDIWTNYQFSINFMPTLVERKHCNRWFKYGGTDYYWFNINPNRDRLQQMNSANMPRELAIPKVTVRVCTSVAKSERQDNVNYYYTVNPTYEEKEIGIVWALIQFTNTYKDSYDQQQFALVPIQTEGFDFVPHHPQHIEDYVLGQIQADSEFRSETFGDLGTNHQEMYGSCFLTLAMLESQGQSLVLRDEDDYAVTINSIQILPALPITDNSNEIIHYDQNGKQYIHFNSESFFLVEKSFNVVGFSYSSENSFRYFFKQWVSDSLERLETVKKDRPEYLSCVSLGYFTPTLPKPPSQTGEFSQDNEPMMFFEPVMTRTLMTRDGQQSTIIPDIVFNFNQNWQTSHVYNLYLRMSFKLSASRCEMTYYVSPFESNLVAITDDLKQQITGITLKQKSYLFDILNDTYADYCVRQRDIDRRMMYMNILTGGIQESGSTAVSQGIGYRSNMERANKEQILNDTGGGSWDPFSYSRSEQLNSMYKNYQMSQAQMSQVGGVQAFGANAIGQTARYDQLQNQMKNSSSIVSQMADWQDQVQNGKLGVCLIETVCDTIQRQKYLELFTKYGYQVNSVQIPNLKTRKYFDYIKTGGQVLQTDLNQYIQSQLCTIFDNGVTIWHMDYCQTQNFILNQVYYYDNTERALLTGGEN